ncbi:MAG TPA: sulfatase-like hydrolase/transferase [Candidatus Saccharimonadales bacterium]|nr:sulfatase-like hydrolase/transferase [Candidatus Saccharimonadales bacterium]
MTQTSPRSIYGLEHTNVLFITLDCCRYDTFEAAHLPHLKSISAGVPAYTHGTYTLPAHMSFFMGYLPVATTSEEPYLNPAVRQLWRLDSGRPRSLETVGVKLSGATILEGYKRLGFQTIGAGGVRWFRNPTLRSLFDTFLFYGPAEETSVFAPREHDSFALNHQSEILRHILPNQNFFLFINCLETHVPYDTGDKVVSAKYRDIMRRSKSLWGCKAPANELSQVRPEELRLLHDLQKSALETVDKRIGALLDKLPRPLLLVVTGDHGECFGEDGLWGHGIPRPKVMEVPLIVSILRK